MRNIITPLLQNITKNYACINFLTVQKMPNYAQDSCKVIIKLSMKPTDHVRDIYTLYNAVSKQISRKLDCLPLLCVYKLCPVWAI